MNTLEEKLEKVLERIDVLESKLGIKQEQKSDDKFAELKEAHKNGAVIECLQSDGEWFEIEDPQWQTGCEYRIKPIEEPKVGDVCKFWDDYEDEYMVGIVAEIDDNINDYYKYSGHGGWYKNAKVLTQEEVIKLLFNK